MATSYMIMSDSYTFKNANDLKLYTLARMYDAMTIVVVEHAKNKIPQA